MSIEVEKLVLSGELLGEGLWGAVYALKDGSVLKVAKRRCAGIGDGLRKIEREFEVLKSLEALETSFELPRGIAYSQFKKGAVELHPDCSLALQMTAVAGRPFSIAKIEGLSKEELSQISRSLVSSLHELHLALSKSTFQGPSHLEMLAESKEGLEGDKEALELLEGISEVAGRLVGDNGLIHGDFNISNILFKDFSVSAVVDFAETRLGFVEEDLAQLFRELPSLKPFLLEDYESRTGVELSEMRLRYAEAMNLFFSFAIARRFEAFDEAESIRPQIKELLSQIS